MKIKMTERYGIGVTDARGIFGAVTGNSVSHSQQVVRVEAPLVIKTPNGDSLDVAKEILLIRYILQRTVPDYDEIVKQFNAIEDIKGAEQWDK
jgi:hypothetical protein